MPQINENGLDGQQVVVVGGASGIGLSTAVAAGAAGAQVTVLDIDQDGLDAAADTVPGCLLSRVDILDEGALLDAFAALPSLDHVYVSAGSTQLGALLEAPVEEQLAPLRLRLWGSVYVIRAAAPRVRAGGSITLTGGVSSDRPVPGAWVSSVATQGAEQLARAMALELPPVRFNAVAPGFTDTPMWDQVLGEKKREVLAAALPGQLTGRLVRPEEVADAVLFLMTNESVTGEVVHIDGGRRLT